MRPRLDGIHLVGTPSRCARPQSPTSGRLRVREWLSRRELVSFACVCCSFRFYTSSRTRAATRRPASFHVTQQRGPTRADERYSVRLAALCSTFPTWIVRPITCPEGCVIVLFNLGCVRGPAAGMLVSKYCASVCLDVAMTYEPIVSPFLRSRTANAPRPAPSIFDGATR